MKYDSDYIDEACKALVGHDNWTYADQIIDSDTVQCSIGENIAHIIIIFDEPLDEE